VGVADAGTLQMAIFGPPILGKPDFRDPAEDFRQNPTFGSRLPAIADSHSPENMGLAPGRSVMVSSRAGGWACLNLGP